MSHFRPTFVPVREFANRESFSTTVPLSHFVLLDLLKRLENRESGGKRGILPDEVGRWDSSAESLGSELGRQVGRKRDEAGTPFHGARPSAHRNGGSAPAISPAAGAA